MEQEIQTTIHTEDGVRVSVDQWDDGGAWLSLQVRGGSAYAAMTRKEAEQLLAGLQAVLNAEVTA
jgi:hypothetical protein